MLLLEGYRSGEREAAVRAPELHVALRDVDARQVWLRPFAPETRSSQSSAERARALLDRFACDGLIQALDAGWSEDRPVLVLERPSGAPADVVARAGAAGADQVLAFGLQLARTFERLHAAGMLVGELAPDQIWIDAATLRARIIDLSRARRIGDREPAPGAEPRDFALVSPEHSGWVSWEVSVRSDLYGLGALLYLLASGRAPCGSGDGVDVIRGHVAGTPAPLHALRPAIPPALSRIVARLLEKHPDKRYQTARGLEADLLECQEQLARDGTIAEEIALGRRDPTSPARARALAQASRPTFDALREGLERVRGGGREWLIAMRPHGGPPPAAALAAGPGAATICFASGSFDACEGDVPYAGLRRVVASIARQILFESGERLAAVRDELMGLGELRGALLDWAPELVPLCTPDDGASLARLRGPRALRRIGLGLARLAQRLARPERPLVLALDDLERGHLQSIELVAEILIQSEAEGLLVISACGEPSGELATALEAAVERVARSGARVQRVALALDAAADAPDPAALPEAARGLLASASVLGLRFELSTLAKLLQRESEAVLGQLAPALEMGLVEVCAEGLRFCDARSFEWACAQLGAADRARLSGAAAAQLDVADPDHALFARVRLLAASELSGAGRNELAQLCVRAAHRALSLGAASCAAELARHGVELGPEDAAPAELELLAAESEWLDGRGEQALARLGGRAGTRASELDRARSLVLRLEITSALEGSDAALALGVRELRALGVRVAEQPNLAAVRRTLQRAERSLRTSQGEALSDRAGDSDPKQQAKLVALSALLPMASAARPLLAAALAAEGILCMLKSGASESPAPFTAAYALAQASLCANYEESARRAALALKLEARWPDPSLRPRLELDMYLLALPWVMHRRKAIEPLRRVAREAEQMGDLDRAAFATWGADCFALLIAEPLSGVERRLGEIAERFGRYGHPLVDVCRQAAQILHVLSVPDGNDTRPPVSSSEPEPPLARGFGATCSALVAYLAGRFERALEALDVKDEESLLGDVLPFASERVLLRGLSAAGLATGASRSEQRAHVRTVRACAEKLRALAEAGPENFEHQALLMEAELARIENRGRSALALYARAGDRAEAQGYRHHAAIAHERRGMTALGLGLMSDGARFVHEAILQLEEWGARTVADRLIEGHSELLAAYAPLPTRTKEATVRVGRTTTTTITTTGRTETKTLDLATVLRSSEAISGEVELDRVIERVMAIAIENAGAQRAVLLLDRNGELRVEAEGAVGGAAARREQVALERAGEIVPVNLVQYVQRTRRSVVLRDASSEGLFVEDPYVTANFVRSVLCVPILRQGRLVGVLYLENGLVTDAFTEGRVEVLRMLSSHAAISLDNARLYTELTELNRDLEARIEERTQSLREARDAAEAATQAKSEFLAVMSHEIRTPMNVVIGMAQIMMDTELSQDQRDCVRAIHTAGDSLLNVINDILDFSKIEAGKLELEVVPFSLRRCIEDVVEILAPRAHKKGLEFPIFVERRVPEALQGDPNRLKQVVINFVNNAIKFTEHGSIEIHIEAKSVEAERALLRFEVRDTGIGIPKDRLDRLFQSFSQVDASTTRKYGGTGLGLVISKRLIEAMKGEVGVDSVEGEGSTFWFEASFERGVEEADAPIEAARALVLHTHAPSARGLVEKIAALRVEADPVDTAPKALERIEAEQAAGRPYTALFLRYPLEDPAWEADVLRMAAVAGMHVFPLCTLQERSVIERDLPDGFARLLTRPVKRDHLRSALALSIGVELDEQRAQGRGLSSEALIARSRYRILVAEDYALNRKLALRMLTRAGYTCEVVDDGRKVLEAVSRERFDLILMDCQMPEVDGFTATRQIRRREAIDGGHVPIVAMTANAMKGDRERCIQAGMDDYLSKPIQVEALYALLTRYLPDSPSTPAAEPPPKA